MVCRHICGIQEFLSIGFGVTKVTAAFYVVCPDCLRQQSFENQREELEFVHMKAKEMDIMSGIREQNHLSDVCTYDMAQIRLKTVRPEIKVRNTLSVSAGGWLV
jgi:hypothetical protein